MKKRDEQWRTSPVHHGGRGHFSHKPLAGAKGRSDARSRRLPFQGRAASGIIRPLSLARRSQRRPVSVARGHNAADNGRAVGN